VITRLYNDVNLTSDEISLQSLNTSDGFTGLRADPVGDGCTLEKHQSSHKGNHTLTMNLIEY